jgi:hypothetical protein
MMEEGGRSFGIRRIKYNTDQVRKQVETDLGVDEQEGMMNKRE